MNARLLLNSLALAVLTVGLTLPSTSFAQQRGKARGSGDMAKNSSRIAFPNQSSRKTLAQRTVASNSKKPKVAGKIRQTGTQRQAQYYGGQNVANKVRSNQNQNFQKAKSITRDNWYRKYTGAPGHVRPTPGPTYVPSTGPIRDLGDFYQGNPPAVAPTVPGVPLQSSGSVLGQTTKAVGSPSGSSLLRGSSLNRRK